MQGAAQRAGRGDRQALSGRLDALSVSRAAVQGRRPTPAAPITPITSGSIATTRSGSGANVPIAEANGSEALLALVNGKFVNIHIPYPMGFFSKNVDGRIDDPNAGWKGRGIWTTTGTRTVFHNEGGTASRPKVYKVQVRPDPLAR